MSNSVFLAARRRRDGKLVVGAVAGVLVIGGFATACNPDTGQGGTTTAGTKTVPAFVGMGLQSAQDAAQKQGFYSLTSHDALGRDRHQILDRDWKVCSQNVKAGTRAATGTRLDFGAVKLAETCPPKDRSAPPSAGSTMPDFKGDSVNTARAALASGTSVTVRDASGKQRFVLLESNWQVCSQKPSAGTRLTGQPVQFNAVKFGESCP